MLHPFSQRIKDSTGLCACISLPLARCPPDASLPPGSHHHGFTLGVVLNFSNPLISLFTSPPEHTCPAHSTFTSSFNNHILFLASAFRAGSPVILLQIFAAATHLPRYLASHSFEPEYELPLL